MSEKIIDKIRKLLALANSDNEHEAALASSRATDLMLQHDLKMSDVQQAIMDEGGVDREDVFTGRRLAWKIAIFNAVANANLCQSIYVRQSRGNGIYQLCGRKPRIAVATAVYEYLEATVERLTKKEMRRLKSISTEPFDHGRYKTWTLWSNEYKLGMATRLYKRITEDAKRRREEGIPESDVTAIVVADAYAKAMAEIEAIIGHMKWEGFGKKRVGTAFQKGQEAADQISLNTQVKAGAQRKALA